MTLITSLTCINLISEIHDYPLFWKVSFNTRNPGKSKPCSLLSSLKNHWVHLRWASKSPSSLISILVLFHTPPKCLLNLFSHLPPWQALSHPVPTEGRREYSDPSVSSAYNSYGRKNKINLSIASINDQSDQHSSELY